MTPTPDCLDAETLAAWMDGALDRPAVAAAEAHVSNCERCQALVATFAKTEPVVTGSEARGTPARGTSRVWRWWLAPIAAGAAAVTLWMVVPDGDQGSGIGEQGSGIGDQGTGNRGQGAGVSESPALRDMARVAEAPAAPAESQRQDAAPARAAKVAEPETGKPDAAKPEATVASVPAAPAAATPAPPAPPAAQALASRERAEADVEKNVAFAEKREADAAAESDVLATANVGPAIAWQVGRKGLVRVTTDGTTFTRVPFPEAIDLVAVTAYSPTAATVTARDGRRFETRDGGKTWRMP